MKHVNMTNTDTDLEKRLFVKHIWLLKWDHKLADNGKSLDWYSEAFIRHFDLETRMTYNQYASH